MIKLINFIYESDNLTDSEISKKKQKYEKWKKLINMSAGEITKFMNSEEGADAGLSKEKASTAGVGGRPIKTGRESAKWIIKMLSSGSNVNSALKNWGDAEWRWCGRQISFNSRMKAGRGELVKDGKMTRRLKSLLIWGHDPRK